MEKKIRGKVWKFGDDINTDVIYPGKYTYQSLSPDEMASHAMEDLDPDFAKNVKPGDIIVAGKNFGMGSSREQAATSLKYAGIKAIIAKSFSRIYFRNAINQGLFAITSKDAPDVIDTGKEIEIDIENGEIITKRGKFKFSPYPQKVMEILEDGGLIEHIRKKAEDEKHH